MIALGSIFWLILIAVQGGVIFGTARFLLRLPNRSRWLEKCAAMIVSYSAWTISGVAAYVLLGGSSAMMEGALLLVGACFSGAIASCVYAVAWVLRAPA